MKRCGGRIHPDRPEGIRSQASSSCASLQRVPRGAIQPLNVWAVSGSAMGVPERWPTITHARFGTVAVGMRVRSNVWPVGTGDFFHAFFSTISARLEPDGWGMRFPSVMGELYRGKLSSEDAAAALAELDQIREELRQFPPSDVVWDVEDRSKRPPWGDEISDEITDLSHYFVTEDGRDLFDVLAEAIGYASRAGAPLRVQ